MPLYIFTRFEPKPGRERELLDELLRVLEPTRPEPGCIRINLYQSPAVFYIHSEWIDEAAFEAHIELPHTVRLVNEASKLITHPLEAVRTKQIA